MRGYQAPIQDIRFILHEVIALKDVLNLRGFSGVGSEVVDAVLEEAARFTAEKLAPLNSIGDKQGAIYTDGKVQMPTGFKEAYLDFYTNGWNSIPFPPEYGGQGLPCVVSAAVSEMVSGANMAFGLCPLLTQGAVELLSHHASAAQKEAYLAKLVSGEWTGTMCLTEPQAGSDLGAISTQAVKQGDHYTIKGQKIYITYGEHDLAENIIHMVLARIQGAPAGTKGISLFIVPKYLADGTRNDVKALSIEHKLGIHASPTCVMAFGEQEACIGYLVGEEHNGLRYMFTMMNNARLAVGIEGIGVAEYALQLAERYALERTQMGIAIANHPDVKRMLLSMRCQIESMRTLALFLAKILDLAKYSKSIKTQEHYAALVSFLVPVLKAHATNMGFECCSEAIQVFGGIGYIEETGISQCLRDIRITMIYEGTNGIQAQDLVMRKLNLASGAGVEALVTEISAILHSIGTSQVAHAHTVQEAWRLFMETTKQMQQLVAAHPKQAQFVAAYYTTLCGIVLGAVMLLWQEASLQKTQVLSVEDKYKKQEIINFYMRYILPQAESLRHMVYA